MSAKLISMVPLKKSSTAASTTPNMKPELLVSLNFSGGLAKLPISSLKSLITSMERMGVEYALISQTSLLPSKMATKKFGRPKGWQHRFGNSS